ncbi:hypothetical protein [Ruminococcus sp.]|uniref:hypothetical protein n=1 Tax=Ruminococcus sp. TaxID=41978 RepID=UPI0038673B95
MAQRFQPKKLNKEDHKKVDKAADNAKKGFAVASLLVAVAGVAVKIGKPIVKSILKK